MGWNHQLENQSRPFFRSVRFLEGIVNHHGGWTSISDFTKVIVPTVVSRTCLASRFFCRKKSMRFETQSFCRGRTHLKFNIAPLKIGHPKRKPIFQPSIFRGYVKLQVGFPIKGGMTIPNIRSLDPGSFQKWMIWGLPFNHCFTKWKIITSIFARDLTTLPTTTHRTTVFFWQTQSMTMIDPTSNFALGFFPNESLRGSRETYIQAWHERKEILFLGSTGIRYIFFMANERILEYHFQQKLG